MSAQTANGAARVLDLKRASRNGSPRKAPVTVLSPFAELRETPTDLVVRVRLEQGALELSVPKRALCDPRPARDGVVRGNPDATPC